MRIKILKNGSYQVTGGIPIREMMIVRNGDHYDLSEGRKLPQREEYRLCRCGLSANAPFCDGSHIEADFSGQETASRQRYNDRIEEVVRGQNMILLDDGRCAYARFCHSTRGDVWSLVRNGGDSDDREEAIMTAQRCPSGRLVVVNHLGQKLEAESQPEIIILQDPEQGTSAGIYVRGYIQIESAEGELYEPRNRVTLCRCGQSDNKPYCDAAHIHYQYQDN